MGERILHNIPEGYKPQDTTQRVKVALPTIATPLEAIAAVEGAWAVADQMGYSTPLVQVRAIVPLDLEPDLITSAASLGNGTVVNGRIPFYDPISERQVAIYYIQRASQRLQYTFSDPNKNISHDEAIRRAREHGVTQYNGQTGYTIVGLAPGGGVLGNGKGYDIEKLAVGLVESHKQCFAYPHDPNQQTVEGMTGILNNNPNVIAFDINGRIAAVGVMERDESFVVGVNVYEPTFWTVPDHRRRGLSIGLRQEVMRLADKMGNTVVFSESIRPTSFLTSQRSGCNLAGTDDLVISGDLGNAYTAIGPANPNSGLMPMGLTYYTSQDICI